LVGKYGYPLRSFEGHALRRRTFSSDPANLLPGPLAATRTGLTPASDDELTTKDHLHQVSSSLLGARITGVR
jgi:hypothetical protein